MKKNYLTKANELKNKAMRFAYKASGKACALCTMCILMTPSIVYASGNDAETMWSNIVNFILPWVQRAGGAIALVGAIMFFLGWRRDDPEQKTQGTNTIIAGCGVFAVGTAGSIFLL